MRLLVVKLSSLGDVVQTLPVLHDIHAHFPKARIDWVVEEGFAELVRQAPSVERVIPIAQRRWRRSPLSARTRGERGAAQADLRREAYDAVIDFQGLVSPPSSRGGRGGARRLHGHYGNRSELCGTSAGAYLLQTQGAMRCAPSVRARGCSPPARWAMPGHRTRVYP